MATRELLDPRTLLLVALGCSGCADDHDDWDDFTPDFGPRACELELVDEAVPPSEAPSRLLHPSVDLRIACGPTDFFVGRTSVGIGAEGVYVAAIVDGYPYQGLYRLEHLDRESVTGAELPWPRVDNPYWLQLAVDEGGLVSLFGYGFFQMPWRAMATNGDWPAEELGPTGFVERVEIAGSQPHVWLWREGQAAEEDPRVHVTTSADGTWFEEPSLSVEGTTTRANGLDGSGDQLAYGYDYDTGNWWTFDGMSTEHAGLSLSDDVVPIPMAHPTDPTHEHAAVLVDWAHVEFLWPRREGGNMVIPPSPTYDNDLVEPCLMLTDFVAARTADGRVWLAWIVSSYGNNCEAGAATEAGTLRLVEIDPARTQPREVMRVELDTANLATNPYYPEIYYGALSLAAFDQQLVLVVADGPEHARLRVLSVDTSR